MDEAGLRYRAREFWFFTKIWNFLWHDFLFNFDFLKNGKRYRWDFFTIHTIDDGLSINNNNSTHHCTMVTWYSLPFSESLFSYIGLSSRINALEWIRGRLIWNSIECCSQKFVLSRFSIENISRMFHSFFRSPHKPRLILSSESCHLFSQFNVCDREESSKNFGENSFKKYCSLQILWAFYYKPWNRPPSSRGSVVMRQYLMNDSTNWSEIFSIHIF